MLVADLGYNEAAKRLNVKPALLRQWAHRGKWSVPIKTDSRVTLVTRKPADVHAEALQSLERETRLSLAKYGAKASKDAEGATLRDSGHVKEVAQTAAIVHRWNQDKSSTQILNIGILTGQDRPEKVVKGVEVETQGSE